MRVISGLLAATVAGLLATSAYALPIDLGTAGSFAVLAGTTITSTGLTTISGNVGVDPGTAITGFGPGIVTGGTFQSSSAAMSQAKQDLASAYGAAVAKTGAVNLTGQDLGGLTLTPGTYFFASSAGLTGTLNLDAQGQSDAQFVFQIGSTLTTASKSSIDFLNNASGQDVFWQVGSSATLGAGTSFGGSILALASITIASGSSLGCGRALAENGAVMLDTDSISNCGTATGDPGPVGVPEPASIALLGLGFIGTLGAAKLKFRKKADAV